MVLLATTLCFVACHGGPADHFATFAQELERQGYRIELYGSGPALKKFEAREVGNLHPFSTEKGAHALVEQLASYDLVITDLGDCFDVELHLAMKEATPGIPCYTYYDNAEPFVPGGYSEIAAKVMQLADKVLFSNANLVNAFPQLASNQKVGIGFYPTQGAKRVKLTRQLAYAMKRRDFFKELDLEDQGQEILVYVGGNNTTYFEEAFPAFLDHLAGAISSHDLSDKVIIFQQHPGAKKKGIDTALLQDWLNQYGSHISAPHILFSQYNSTEVQHFADRMLYYQTSMAPQFILAGLPTLQVGHAVYEDLLVRSSLCETVTTSDQLIAALAKAPTMSCDQDVVYQGLGIKADYIERLERVVREKSHVNEIE